MNTTTDKTLSVALIPKAQKVEKEQYVKDWAQYSQWIVAAMSKRMSELGLTQLTANTSGWNFSTADNGVRTSFRFPTRLRWKAERNAAMT